MDKYGFFVTVLAVGSFSIFMKVTNFSPSTLVRYKTTYRGPPVKHDSCEISEQNYTYWHWVIYGRTIVHIDDLNIVYCPILKNMHTRMLALFGRYLMGNSYDLVTKENITNVWSLFGINNATGIIGVNMGLNIRELRNKIRPQSYPIKFALIRDPIERFISAYLYVCRVEKRCRYRMLFECEDDVFCLLGNISALIRDNNWPIRNAVLVHMAPQYFFCYFRHCKSGYRLFYYSDSEDVSQPLTDFLVKQGVPADMLNTGWGEKKNSSWLAELSQHSTVDKYAEERKSLLSNMRLVNEIYRVYKEDYDFFKLNVPKVFRDRCKETEYRHLDVCQRPVA